MSYFGPRPDGTISRLFLLQRREDPLGLPAGSLELVTGVGIAGDLHAEAFSPRQLLVVRRETIAGFGIAPGALGENLVVEGVPAEAFVPGAVIRCASGVAIRLTMHCVPCRRIAHLGVDLKRLVQARFSPEPSNSPSLSIMSFGYRYGVPPQADLVFDVRFLPNPYFVPELKGLTVIICPCDTVPDNG